MLMLRAYKIYDIEAYLEQKKGNFGLEVNLKLCLHQNLTINDFFYVTLFFLNITIYGKKSLDYY